MKGFIWGFISASAIFGGIFVAQDLGVIPRFGVARVEDPQNVGEMDTHEGDVEGGVIGKKKRVRGGRKSRGAQEGHPGHTTGEGRSGDNLGAPGGGNMDMGASSKEEQLKESEIDRGIDSVFRGIERCLVLVPADAPASGKVVVGMRIDGTGRVLRVNLQGPNFLVQGETGGCIRRIVKSIQFPRFDGPEMLVHYPITFE